MNLGIAYAMLGVGLLAWALLVRKLRARPWEASFAGGDEAAADTVRSAPARTGLWVFLAVVTSLFGLFVSAYFMRMQHVHGATPDMSDWQPLAEPPILWANTAMLIVASVAMQWARVAAAQARSDAMRTGLMLGGAATAVFLAGQIAGWRAVAASQFATPRDPALAFFYVLTVVHALHLLGGLAVWRRTLSRLAESRRAPQTVRPEGVRLAVELCAVYWHFLLLVWLGLFAVLLST